MANYKYTLKRTGKSSATLGNCEVCGKYADEIYIQSEKKKYGRGWTYHGCRPHTFGHKKCLLSIRR